MSRLKWAMLAVFLAVVPGRAVAHPVPFSYLDVRLEPNALGGTLVVHVIDAAHELSLGQPDSLLDPQVAARHFQRLTTLLSGRLRLLLIKESAVITWTRLEAVPERQSLRLHFQIASAGIPASIRIDAALFPYDPNHKTFVNVYEGEALTQAILDRSKTTFDYFAGTRQGTFAVVQKFLPSGVHHILIGPDHLLFLIGLLLLGGTFGRLLLIVTGFTVGHSVTLSLAALNLVSPPASVIEPAIALSIIYVGVDNLMVRKGRDLRPWIALAFGLIHGFGFANVLRDMDLPPRALGWSLLSFNVGVEIGQLLVVAVVAALLAGVRAWSPEAGRRVAIVGSVAVIAAGAFWFVERVFLSSLSGGIR